MYVYTSHIRMCIENGSFDEILYEAHILHMPSHTEIRVGLFTPLTCFDFASNRDVQNTQTQPIGIDLWLRKLNETIWMATVTRLDKTN